ncbi:DUF5908 family protein [Aequorivita antarctica]|uniref:Uncharacterized protein n=1 Tax=Aequorivita antarctica TaxID=153266 RepID=A0A5C6Z4R9_9FLAO|nr:DUF5908 family protein [Aequorivita antarctica]TXD74453.1 hypothetical protein ESU54_04170 [Aequorivita antarctica]SRX73812.1 hypothetical protein AEQU3_01247 [Aequorivita antarctica]
MTLIIKELIIRGVVTKSTSDKNEESLNNEDLLQYMEQMKKSIKEECIETVLSKLESKSKR